MKLFERLVFGALNGVFAFLHGVLDSWENSKPYTNMVYCLITAVVYGLILKEFLQHLRKLDPLGASIVLFGIGLLLAISLVKLFTAFLEIWERPSSR